MTRGFLFVCIGTSHSTSTECKISVRLARHSIELKECIMYSDLGISAPNDATTLLAKFGAYYAAGRVLDKTNPHFLISPSGLGISASSHGFHPGHHLLSGLLKTRNWAEFSTNSKGLDEGVTVGWLPVPEP